MRALFLILALMYSVLGNANVRYDYVGNPYSVIDDLPLPPGTFDTSMRVSGFFELANPLAANMSLREITPDVLAFSFSNGRGTLTISDPRLTTIFAVQTNATGQIELWDIFVEQALTLTSLGDHDTHIDTQNDNSGLFSLSGIQDQGVLAMCEPSGVPRGLCRLFGDIATVENSPGRWSSTSVSTSVDEPSCSLTVIGLSFFASVLARKRAGYMRRGGSRK